MVYDAHWQSHSPAQCGVFAGPALAADDSPGTLKVCADPDNMPQSNTSGEGYENRIAAKLASDLGQRLEYTFFPQRMGFVRNTLRQKDETTDQYKCDVIIGVPKGYELTATTKPYMHSTYAMVLPARGSLSKVETPEDLLKLPAEELRALKIGVFARSPAVDWLLRNKLLDQGVFYAQQTGDMHENPAVIIDRDLAAGTIDLAIVWGPVAGYLASRHARIRWLAHSRVQAGSGYHIRLRDFDGCAFRREGVEGHS